MDSGCEVAALSFRCRNAPVPCNVVASSCKTLAGELAGGRGMGRRKELLPGPCCAVIGHGEIDGINPPRSPPWAQDGPGGPVTLASLSGSPVPIGHLCGMSPDCKLELRVRRVCARVFARVCGFSERTSFSELDSSPPECPDGADNAAPGSGEFRAIAGVESVSDAGFAGDGAVFLHVSSLVQFSPVSVTSLVWRDWHGIGGILRRRQLRSRERCLRSWVSLPGK